LLGPTHEARKALLSCTISKASFLLKTFSSALHQPDHISSQQSLQAFEDFWGYQRAKAHCPHVLL